MTKALRRTCAALITVGSLLALAVAGQDELPAGTVEIATDDQVPIELAITIDDLPWVGPHPPDTRGANAAIDRIAAVLRVHEAPATGFVVCDHAVQDPAPLQNWAAWGLHLGNHSAAHRDLNTTPVDQWLRDVRTCDDFLRSFGDAYKPFVRFPMLHQGDTDQKRARVSAALAAMGMRTAHVTVDNSDWILTQAHAQALATDDAVLRRDVGRAFVRHVVDALTHADRVARRKVGRPVPQVLLLHANSVVVDQLDELLLGLRARGVRFVSLEQALADPVYDRADVYTGPKGLSWLYRMQPATPGDAAWDDARAAAIRHTFAAALAGERGATAGSDVSMVRLSPDAPPGLTHVVDEASRSARMRSLLVMHRGELLAEAYFNGAGPETAANLKSVTKSLSAALVGVAVERGWIKSLDDAIGMYLPGIREAHPRQATITIHQLLTMSSGLRPVSYGAIQQRADWVAALLAQDVDEEAVGVFQYDTPVLQLLSALLRAASGMPVAEMAQRLLFAPMGDSLIYWRTDARDIALGGNDAYLRPRDLIDLGELYRRQGVFQGQTLLPQDYVQASSRVQIIPSDDRVNHGTLSVRGYGYLWWLLTLGGEPVYAALGHGGQILLVSPERELVVLMTSRWPSASSTEHYQHLTRILVSGVLPLFRSAS